MWMNPVLYNSSCIFQEKNIANIYMYKWVTDHLSGIKSG